MGCTRLTKWNRVTPPGSPVLRCVTVAVARQGVNFVARIVARSPVRSLERSPPCLPRACHLSPSTPSTCTYKPSWTCWTTSMDPRTSPRMRRWPCTGKTPRARIRRTTLGPTHLGKDHPMQATTTDSQSMADRAHALKDAYLTCRTLGHAWRPRTASWNAEARAYYAAYLCERCHGERSCWFDQYGRPVSNRYTYPEGYVMPGVGRLDRDDRGTIRLEALARQMGQTVTTLLKAV